MICLALLWYFLPETRLFFYYLCIGVYASFLFYLRGREVHEIVEELKKCGLNVRDNSSCSTTITTNTITTTPVEYINEVRRE
jgi:hypothetical protein